MKITYEDGAVIIDGENTTDIYAPGVTIEGEYTNVILTRVKINTVIPEAEKEKLIKEYSLWDLVSIKLGW